MNSKNKIVLTTKVQVNLEMNSLCTDAHKHTKKFTDSKFLIPTAKRA
jgi:hypothetical protein